MQFEGVNTYAAHRVMRHKGHDEGYWTLPPFQSVSILFNLTLFLNSAVSCRVTAPCSGFNWHLTWRSLFNSNPWWDFRGFIRPYFIRGQMHHDIKPLRAPGRGCNWLISAGATEVLKGIRVINLRKIVHAFNIFMCSKWHTIFQRHLNATFWAIDWLIDLI